MSVVMTYPRSVPGGSELRTRFWMGWAHHLRCAPLMLPEGALPIEVPRALAPKAQRKGIYQPAILPQVYAEERDRF